MNDAVKFVDRRRTDRRRQRCEELPFDRLVDRPASGEHRREAASLTIGHQGLHGQIADRGLQPSNLPSGHRNLGIERREFLLQTRQFQLPGLILFTEADRLIAQRIKLVLHPLRLALRFVNRTSMRSRCMAADQTGGEQQRQSKARATTHDIRL